MPNSSSSKSSLKGVPRRRPPSPVSMYGSGAGLGMVAPKAPRPLVTLEKKPQPQTKTKSHTRSISASTTTSALSESSANNTPSPSPSSVKSKKSTTSFGLSGWKKRAQSSSTSLPSSPMTPTSPSVHTMPTSNIRSSPSETSIARVPSETETEPWARQIDKVTRTVGERVPAEYLQRHIYEVPSIITTLPLEDPIDPILPADDLRHEQSTVSNSIEITPSNVVGPSSGERCRTSSPVLPNEDDRDLNQIRPLSSSSTQVDISPILFTSSLPDSVSPPPRPEKEPAASLPFVQRVPRPKPEPLHSLPSSSLGYKETSAGDNGTIKLRSPRRPSTSSTPTTHPPTTTRRPSQLLPLRPKTSHGISTPSQGGSVPHPRPDSPFQDSSIPIHTWVSTTWSSPKKGCIIRQEGGQGWSGEWNRSDMQDVIATLRQLK